MDKLVLSLSCLNLSTYIYIMPKTVQHRKKRKKKKSAYDDQSKKRRRQVSKTIPVSVVDEHCDTLESIHHAIRSKYLPFEFRLVHFDAHPDMCVTSKMCADTVFEPRKMYDVLDKSEGGIAEWIVPLIYGGHVKEVVWVKPEWADQMCVGKKKICVGKRRSDGSLGIDSDEPYFVDDFTFSHRSEMVNLREDVTLDVITTTSRITRYSECPYVLDICLDYFSTKNPFARELTVKFGSEAVKLIYNVFVRNTQYRGVKTKLNHSEQIRHRTSFEKSISKFVSLCKSSSGTNDHQTHFNILVENMATQLYNDTQVARELLREFASFLQNLESSDDLKLVMRNGPMLDLPDHVSSLDEMRTALDDMKTYLSRIRGSPRLITIACSLDGYTPDFHLDFLIKSILQILRELYGAKTLDIVVAEHAPKRIHVKFCEEGVG